MWDLWLLAESREWVGTGIKWSKVKTEVEWCLRETLPGKLSEGNFGSRVIGCGFRPAEFPPHTLGCLGLFPRSDTCWSCSVGLRGLSKSSIPKCPGVFPVSSLALGSRGIWCAAQGQRSPGTNFCLWFIKGVGGETPANWRLNQLPEWRFRPGVDLQRDPLGTCFQERGEKTVARGRRAGNTSGDPGCVTVVDRGSYWFKDH